MPKHTSWHARLLRGSFAAIAFTAGAFVWIACSGPAASSDSFPETCAEIQEAIESETGDRPANGTYTLYVDGDEKHPWDAYCHNMGREEPAEYLSVNERSNYSQRGDGTKVVITTSYRRLRIDPTSLEIDPNDTTFASSETESSDDLPDLPAGLAVFQGATLAGTRPARARIDLSGTGFSFDEEVDNGALFCIESTNKEADQSSIDIAQNLESVLLSAQNSGLATSAAGGGCSSKHPLTADPASLGAWPLVYGDSNRQDRCGNGTKDGRETDVDCGGNCTTKCAVSKRCGENSDCVTRVCRSNICQEADAGTDASIDSGTDAGTDAGIDSGADAGTDASIDSGADAGTDAGVDSGADAGTDAGVDSGADAGTDASIDSGADASIDGGADASIDSGADAGIDAGVDSGLSGAKMIFMTGATYDGNLGGVAGADAKCQSDVNRPNSSTYKAMIVDGFYRVACTQGNENCAANQHVDWVLAPNTVYIRTNGTTVVGTTNGAGIIAFNSAMLASSFGSSGGTAYTGLNSDWTYAGSGCASAGACDCMWFTANSSGYRAPVGNAASLTGTSISSGTASCASSHAIYCVEQ